MTEIVKVGFTFENLCNVLLWTTVSGRIMERLPFPTAVLIQITFILMPGVHHREYNPSFCTRDNIEL